MFVPADRVKALGIYCRYCILRRRIVTELVFRSRDSCLPAATPDLYSQGLAKLRQVSPDVSSHNLRKTFATRLLSRGAAITDVQHLLGHASVKTTEKAYAAFLKNERSSRQLICWIRQCSRD